MEMNAIATIARQELIINIRNRWTLIFAVAFGVLVLAISYFGLVTAGAIGFQGFARTSASLLNLVLYVVPLLAVTMGTLSFTNEKSLNEMLFVQPLTRAEILLGKLAGLFASIFTATLIGFGVGGMIIAAQAGTDGALRYPLLVAFALLLALVFLSLSALIAALCRRQTKAFGVALFIWFFYVLFYDLLVIGATFLMKERSANNFIFASLFGNPVDMVRVATLLVLDGKEVFGAAGAALLRFLGGEAASITLLVVVLVAWIVIPIFFSQRVLERQDI
ncbi:MAG: ABC transporter permease [Acidobacteria bacterium]|nr:ABC transporter permease [Acidobacteriota bacterium]